MRGGEGQCHETRMDSSQNQRIARVFIVLFSSERREHCNVRKKKDEEKKRSSNLVTCLIGRENLRLYSFLLFLLFLLFYSITEGDNDDIHTPMLLHSSEP